MSKQELQKEFYLVEKILDRRTSSNGSYQYYIKWKNYPHRVNTWEPLAHLSTVSSMVEKFNEEFENQQIKEKVKKKKNLTASNIKHTDNNQCNASQDGEKKRRDNLIQLKLDGYLNGKSLIEKFQESSKSNIFLYRFENQSQDMSPQCSPPPKDIQQPQPSSNFDQYANYLHPNNLFKSMGISLEKDKIYHKKQNPKIQPSFQTPTNLQKKENKIAAQQVKCSKILELGHSKVDSGSKKAYDCSENKKIDGIERQAHHHHKVIEFSSPQPSLHNNQKEIVKVNKTGQSTIPKSDNNEQSTQKQLNSLSIDGSIQSVQKYKFGCEPNQKPKFNEECQVLERSRNKRIKQKQEKLGNIQEKELSLAEGRKRRKITKKDFSQVVKPRIRIDEIPPPISISEQLQDFNHKRLCELQFEKIEAENRLLFKLQNEDRRTVKIEGRQIQKTYPRWLKDYLESFI